MGKLIKLFFTICVSFFTLIVAAQEAPAPNTPKIHIIFMGGNDCLNCVQWRRFDLTKLEKIPAFNRHKFTNVVKVSRSPVPASFFLPSEIRQYKDMLDSASNGIAGSPQMAIIVNDEVFDYLYGSYSADEIELRINAIEAGGQYPYKRCLKVTQLRDCEISR